MDSLIRVIRTFLLHGLLLPFGLLLLLLFFVEVGEVTRLLQVCVDFGLSIFLNLLQELAHIGYLSFLLFKLEAMLLQQSLFAWGHVPAIAVFVIGQTAAISLNSGILPIALFHEHLDLLLQLLDLMRLLEVLFLRILDFLSHLFKCFFCSLHGHFDEFRSRQALHVHLGSVIAFSRHVRRLLPLTRKTSPLFHPVLFHLLLNGLLYEHIHSSLVTVQLQLPVLFELVDYLLCPLYLELQYFLLTLRLLFSLVLLLHVG